VVSLHGDRLSLAVVVPMLSQVSPAGILFTIESMIRNAKGTGWLLSGGLHGAQPEEHNGTPPLYPKVQDEPALAQQYPSTDCTLPPAHTGSAAGHAAKSPSVLKGRNARPSS
jgi:hypothetical protein